MWTVQIILLQHVLQKIQHLPAPSQPVTFHARKERFIEDWSKTSFKGYKVAGVLYTQGTKPGIETQAANIYIVYIYNIYCDISLSQ